jgi:hypothetical protein
MYGKIENADFGYLVRSGLTSVLNMMAATTLASFLCSVLGLATPVRHTTCSFPSKTRRRDFHKPWATPLINILS